MTSSLPDRSSPTDRSIPSDASGIGREMAKGTGWTVMTRLSVQGIGFLSTLILARLLLPADFGLVALATATAGALMAVSEFSFDVVLIQNQCAGRQQYDTAWTLSVCRNGILAACLAAAAASIASFFGEPRMEAIVYCLAAQTFIDGFQNIGIVDFRKALAFHKDLIFTVVGKLGTFGVTVPLAVLRRDYWALVAGIVAGAFLRVGLSYFMHSYRPRFSVASWGEIMHFSKWLLLNNACGFVFNRSDTFIIGKIVGAEAVGIYGIAYEIANLTTSNLIIPLRRAIFPGYSKVSSDLESLRRGFLDVFALVMLVCTPTAVGIGLVADPLVRVMLGAQWIGSIPLIQVLAIYGFLSIISAGSGPIFLARARPHYLAYVLGGSTLLVVPLLIFGVERAGALGASWAVTTTMVFSVIVDFLLVVRLLHLPVRRLAAAGWRPITATAVMTIVVTAVQVGWPMADTVIGSSATLATSMAGGAAAYALAATLLWQMSGRPDGPERQVFAAIRSGVAHISKARAFLGRP